MGENLQGALPDTTHGGAQTLLRARQISRHEEVRMELMVVFKDLFDYFFYVEREVNCLFVFFVREVG